MNSSNAMFSFGEEKNERKMDIENLANSENFIRSRQILARSLSKNATLNASSITNIYQAT